MTDDGPGVSIEDDKKHFKIDCGDGGRTLKNIEL